MNLDLFSIVLQSTRGIVAPSTVEIRHGSQVTGAGNVRKLEYPDAADVTAEVIVTLAGQEGFQKDIRIMPSGPAETGSEALVGPADLDIRQEDLVTEIAQHGIPIAEASRRKWKVGRVNPMGTHVEVRLESKGIRN